MYKVKTEWLRDERAFILVELVRRNFAPSCSTQMASSAVSHSTTLTAEE